MSTHQEAIQCPNCKFKQFGTVEFEEWMPWPVYVHQCRRCKYMITESEWDQCNATEVKMPKNEYGYEVEKDCGFCHQPTTHCRETPYPCSRCKKTACGICCIEQWDGGEGFTCDACRAEIARIERGDWTPQELEEAGQLSLLPEEPK